VDDDLEVLRRTARLLEKEGYPVDRAADGEEALRSVQVRPPRVAVIGPQPAGHRWPRGLPPDQAGPGLGGYLRRHHFGQERLRAPTRRRGWRPARTAISPVPSPIANCSPGWKPTLRIVVLARSLRRQAETLKQNAAAAFEAQAAALNLMEDAVEAQKRLATVNQELRGEIAERKQAEAALRLVPRAPPPVRSTPTCRRRRHRQLHRTDF
jgi:hypothetical protein